MKKEKLRNIALIFILLGILGYLAAPAFIGFAVIPLSLALIFFLAAGPVQWRNDIQSIFSTKKRVFIFPALALLFSLGLLLAVGQINTEPLDFSSNRTLLLTPESQQLLKSLQKPLHITVYLGPQDPRFERVQHLVSLYEKQNPKNFKVKYINPQTDSVKDGEGPRLVTPNTAFVEYGKFKENISPISQEAINSSLARLLNPEHRLIYFLNTIGEKLAQDNTFGGLSHWAEDLSRSRLIAMDYHWPEDTPLPAGASALVIAGPKAPLGEWREKELKKYLQNGGSLLIMADPLTIHFSPEFWESFALKYPEGLVLDPGATLLNTDDSFLISREYPRHNLNEGLSQPSLWPIAGTFLSLEEKKQNDFNVTVYAVATSSALAWLETDINSFVEKEVRYQAETDILGPLALGVAAELKGGGRLLALADSDMAANGFYGFPGNRDFCTASINWLLNKNIMPSKIQAESKNLALSPISLRLIFWLPVVVWPALLIIIWFCFYFKRHSPKRYSTETPKKQ